MPTRRQRVAIHLLEEDFSKIMLLLSPEAGGYLLRIIHTQNQTGRGLPDDDATHVILGLTRRKWLLIRSELMRVTECEDGFIVYRPMLQHVAARRQNSEKDAARKRAARKKHSDTRSSAPVADGQSTRSGSPAVAAAPAKTTPQAEPARKAPASAFPAGEHIAPGRIGDNGDISFAPRAKQKPLLAPHNGTPASPFEVIDLTMAEAVKQPNIVALRRGQQPTLPGIPAGTVQLNQDLPLPSVKKMTFDLGIALLTRRNGLKLDDARRRLGMLCKDYDIHYVYAAIASAIQQSDNVADPWSWLLRIIKQFPNKATTTAQRLKARNGKPGTSPTPAAKPKATPQFMGISPERARRLQEKSDAVRKRQKTQTDTPLQAPAQNPAQLPAANSAAGKTPANINRPDATPSGAAGVQGNTGKAASMPPETPARKVAPALAAHSGPPTNNKKKPSVIGNPISQAIAL